MALRVPAQQIPYVKKFLELPDEKIQGFLDALGATGPKFNVFDLASAISGPLGLPDDLTLGIIQVLASLYLTRDRRQPTEQFVDRDVFFALKASQTFSAEQADVQWKKLRQFLIAALSLERTLGTTAKAGHVLTQHEHIFNGARIMTDLRPIYHLDVSEKPDAVIIIHMLKISQRDNVGNQAEHYFALDSNDIATMKDILERATIKEKTLRGIMKDSGVTVLDPKLVF